ncbi:MAG: aminotransferase class V-fold PLP-dependent enzyme [Flavobacteriales bacterium]|nr:aminotransferase class V-fold PLP-dependent enzyme [Flavobacteriales bacterium]
MGNATSTDWKVLRAEYPGLVRGTYVDTSSTGLMARSTTERAAEEMRLFQEQGSARYDYWHAQGKAAITSAVAAHIGGEAAGLALVQSFTVGLMQLAPLLRHRPKVLLVGGDYPTLHGPFKLHGFGVVEVEPDPDGTIRLEALEAAMAKEKPQLVAISHVQWSTGFLTDLDALAALCRAHGAWSVVDITQSWCSVPVDLRSTPIDILAASGYKWPLAGFGNGFLHLSSEVRDDLLDRHGAEVVPALTVGHQDPMALVRLEDALARAEHIGIGAVAERVQRLCDRAVAGLDRAGVRVLNGREPAHRTGILMIEGGQQRLDRMRQAGVQAQLRGAGIRLGIHFYNNEQDVEQLVEALR